MQTTITTTITTTIDLDTLTPTHDVHIHLADHLPPAVVYAAIQGACQSTIKSLRLDEED